MHDQAPVRLLHVHSGNLMGGVERMLESLAPAHAGRQPVESVYALAFDGSVARMLRDAGAEVHQLGHLHASRPDEIWRARARLRRLLSASPFDAMAVHSSWTQALLGGVAGSKRVPLVRWMHAPDPGPAWAERWSARTRPALIVCNSEYTLQRARPLLGDAAVVVAYPPIASPAPRRTRQDVRCAMQADDRTVVIMMAARLERWKGHCLLLDALSRLRGTRWTAWIAGGPQSDAEHEYLAQLRQRAAALNIADRVTFLGGRSDVADLLCAADLYCQPNVGAEPFGVSFVEALAAGLPVVSTRLGALPEIVDAGCGLLVDPDPTQLSMALDTLLDERMRRPLAAGARRRATRFCDLRASLDRLRDVLSPARLALAGATLR